MIHSGARRRRTVAQVLGAIAVIAAALALWAEATGGFRVYVFGIALSVRGALRPTLVALVFGIVSLHLLNVWRSRAIATALAFLPRAAPWVAMAAALSLFVIGVRFGSRVAGGADGSGYVSQAALWLRGDLKIPQPDIGRAPWPASDWTFSPLGYRPERGDILVPTYASGLPILMAAATLVVGTCGPYLLGPLCAAILISTTYWIGARLSGPIVGLIAAVAVAVSPTLVFMMLHPMSDVPNAAFWNLSMLFALRRGTGAGALLAGVTAGIAILIRPNLAPLAAVPALLTVLTGTEDKERSRVARVALFAAGCVPFIALVAAIFNHLYGSPFRSGYGTVDETYALANAPDNLLRYPQWFFETQGIAGFAFLLTPIAVSAHRKERRTVEMLCFLFIVAVFVAYIFYTAFDAWWYLRFLLAAFPFVFILGADAVTTLAARFGPLARGLALLLFGGLAILTGAVESSARDVTGLGRDEQRYIDAAHYAQSTLPRGAVVLTMQHSGSVAYYTDKLPFRYDIVDPTSIDEALEYLRRQGRPIFVLLDDWEIPVFAARFRGQEAAALVQAQPIAATVDGRVKLFATEGKATGASPAQMPRTYGCQPPAASNRYAR